MSWQLSRQGDQYRIWSTISDQYITDWISRNEALAVWYDSTLLDFKKKVIEQYLKFPCYWGDYDSDKIGAIHMDEDHNTQLCLWLKLLSDTHDEDEYYKLVDETFERIRTELEGKIQNVEGE